MLSSGQFGITAFGAMEYFILALVGKANVTSLYEFQQKASLQPGGIRSAMQRLEENDLVHRAASATRQRRDLSLTAKGEEMLESTWRNCLHRYADADSVFRAVSVALMMNDQPTAEDYLEEQALRFMRFSQEKMVEAAHLERVQDDPLSAYAWMKAMARSRQRRAESEAFIAACEVLRSKHRVQSGQ